MENEQGRGLVLYKNIEQSLARPDQGPKSKIQAVARLNSEVHNHLQIGEFLNTLNEKLFEGKGEVTPLIHTYSISPGMQENEQSRFAKLFSTRVDLNSVSSGALLRIKKDDLRIEKDKKPFDELVVRISQSMDIKTGSYTFYTSGSLFWELPKHYPGRFENSKAVHLSSVSEGRLLSFYLHSVPPMQGISQALLRQVNEVLGELAVQGLIPELNQSSAEEPLEQ